MNHFEDTERIAAIAPEKVEEFFLGLMDNFASEIDDGGRVISTIGAFWDDSAKTRKRAASLPDGTIAGAPLTDGRIAYRCLWENRLGAAFDQGLVPDVEQLTEQEFIALLPSVES